VRVDGRCGAGLPGTRGDSGYEFLPHTADVKVRAWGASVEEAFVACAMALKETMAGEINVAGRLRRKIEVTGQDREAILYAFLEEFLFLLDAESFLFAAVEEVRMETGGLTAEITGDDARRYQFSNDVKAVTYNEMYVRQEGGKWVAQFVLDV